MQILAACHVHSEWSYDGKWPLGRIAEVFSRRGYRVVMMTEHDRGFDESRRREHRAACRQASTDRILLIPGIEYSDPTNSIHLLVWGDVPFIGEGMSVETILRLAAAGGGIVVYAHPSRREAWKLFQPEWAKQLLGIELWNRKTDGWAPSLAAKNLLKSSGTFPFVGMDFHDHKQLFALGTVVELEGSVTEAKVLAALAAGRGAPQAFGWPVKKFTQGVPGLVLRTGEFGRRRAAKLFKQLVKRS